MAKRDRLKEELETIAAKYEQCRNLLDLLVRMVESNDQIATVQAASAGREYLDTNP